MVDLGIVQETLLIPLYYRALDSQQAKPVLNDPHALAIVQAIDYDFSAFDKAWMSYWGCLARGKTIDGLARDFIGKHPEAAVISIGCGLDSMFYRVDNGQIHWYNVDFPDVMALRQSLFEPHPRVHDIACSCLEPAWIEAVERKEQPVLIIAEGVSMYLTPDENQQFLSLICDHFTALQLIYDTVPARVARYIKQSDAVRKTKARYYWGTRDEQTIPQLEPRLIPMAYINNTDEMKKHLRGWQRLLVPLIYLGNNRIAVLRTATLAQ